MFMIGNPSIVTLADSGNKVYDDMKKKNEEDFNKNFDKLSEDEVEDAVTFDGVYDSFHHMAKRNFPLAMICTISLGIIIMIFARKNKSLFRFGLFGLVIGLPIVYIMIVFLLPSLEKIFK